MAVKRRCIGCGYQYDFIGGTEFICPYCGTSQNPGLSADLGDILMNAANLRRNKQFDRSKAEYARVIAKSPETGEAYFGMFLCDYEVNSEEDLLSGADVVFTNASKRPIEKNENYQNAITFSGGSRSRWETIAAKIEELRAENRNIKEGIKENAYRVALICDPDCEDDREIADSVFEALRGRVDVFYPEHSLKNVSPAAHQTATYVALDNVFLLFVVYSEESRKSKYLAGCYDKFFEKHESYLISVIGDEDDVPDGVEYDECIDPQDRKGMIESLLNQIRLMGNLTYEEKNRFREGKPCVKCESDPSPILKV